MKKLLVTLRIVLCSILVFSFMVPVQATDEEFGDKLSEIDKEKIINFLNIRTPSGQLNGDLLHSFPDDGDYEGGVDPMFVMINQYNNTINGFRFMYHFSYYDKELGAFVDGWHSPDFCGVMDMSGTSLYELDCGTYDDPYFDDPYLLCDTSIEGFILNDCINLYSINVSYQYMCTEVVSVNCPNLIEIKIDGSPCRHIELQPGAYESPIDATIMGDGSFSVSYDEQLDRRCTIIADSQKSKLIGWFFNGDFIEADGLSIIVEEGCDLIACYAGDVNGDGDITIVDATLTMRSAISGENINLISQDADADGVVSMIDAIFIARVVLGLI